MTSWAEFNRKGHRVCLAHKTKHTVAFSPALFNPILLFPFQICRGAGTSVGFSYTISCQGPVSDQSGIEKRLRSTPWLLIVQRSDAAHTQSSPGSCNGSSWLPLWIAAIWASQREQRWAKACSRQFSLHGPKVDDLRPQSWQNGALHATYITAVLTHYELEPFICQINFSTPYPCPCQSGVILLHHDKLFASSPSGNKRKLG